MISRVFPLRPSENGDRFLPDGAHFRRICWIQLEIDTAPEPNVGWQLLAYVILLAGEVMASITGLEFSYTQGAELG